MQIRRLKAEIGWKPIIKECASIAVKIKFLSYQPEQKIFSLDVCCLNRPFDDQTQPRIRLESEAILIILAQCEQRQWEWVGSEVLMMHCTSPVRKAAK